MNAKSWYDFVNGECGMGVEDGSIRIVTGVDKVSTWGIATFIRGSREGYLAFRSDGTGVFPPYRWDYFGDGTGRIGPREIDMPDPIQSTAPTLQNQCVFVRTLNFDIAGDSWDDLKTHQVRRSLGLSGRSQPAPLSNHLTSTGSALGGGSLNCEPGNPGRSHPSQQVGNDIYLNTKAKQRGLLVGQFLVGLGSS